MRLEPKVNFERRFAALGKIACLAMAAIAIAGCRLDMHIQPKYLPYEPTTFFADGRSERPPVQQVIGDHLVLAVPFGKARAMQRHSPGRHVG